MSNYNEQESVDLAQWEGVYGEHEVKDSDNFDSLPDGKYQVEVAAVELTISKSGGNPMLAWELSVLGPRYIGRKIWRNNMIMSAENIRWLKQDLWKCGLELEKLSDLKKRLNELLDIRLEVTLKTKKNIQNVFLNKLLTGKEKGTAGDHQNRRSTADAEVYNESDAPF